MKYSSIVIVATCFAVTTSIATMSLSVADDALLTTRMNDPGIKISPEIFVPLLPPVLTGEVDADVRMKKLVALAGGTGWDRFSRKSAVAPVKIKLEYLKDDNDERIGHLIHVAFIAHVELDTLKDQDLMKQMFSEPDPSESPAEEPTQLTVEQLKGFGVTAGPTSKFGKVEIPMLRRVLAKGVLHLQQSMLDDTITLGFYLDPRFNAPNADPMNAWTPTDRDGKPKSDQWNSYEGFGGYLSVHRLPELPGACLIEARVVVHEPTEWFSVSNLLRSKLPLLIQETARSFRRRLK